MEIVMHSSLYQRSDPSSYTSVIYKIRCVCTLYQTCHLALLIAIYSVH